ncbi:MAG: hypothetical protein P4L34_05120 [Paludibacter sp.]|nr:hypothetical protein [Paludibacter sp.]
MKKIILFSLLTLCSTLHSQIIKIENGLSFSSMYSNKFDILNNKITNYGLNVGCDYFEHKLYYLSSDIGLVTKGGKENNLSLGNDIINVNESWQFVQFNTTIRFKYQVSNAHLFVGIGPKLDFLVGSGKFTDSLYSGYEMDRLSLGSKSEVGFVQDINRIRIGLNYSYLINFAGAAKSPYINIGNNTYSLMFSIGYKLK